MDAYRHVLLVFAACVPLVTAVGCDREPDVRRYTAQVDPAPPPIAMPAMAPGTLPTAGPDGSVDPTTLELAWDLPPSWDETGESNEFRLTTLRAGEDDQSVELAVSRVPGPPGSITDNVNRWRRQLGLSSLSKEDVIPFVGYATNERLPALLTDQTNQDRRALIAWFAMDQVSWYFKATGTPAAIDAHREAFDALIASVRPNEHFGHNHGHDGHPSHGQASEEPPMPPTPTPAADDE